MGSAPILVRKEWRILLQVWERKKVEGSSSYRRQEEQATRQSKTLGWRRAGGHSNNSAERNADGTH